MPIALITDFGTKDYFVGAMKGVIASINPDAAVIDITHEIPAHDIRAAAFTLAACWRDFPCGTIFLAVVDPGVGSDRRAILAESENRYFVSPDNGLISLAAQKPAKAVQLTNEKYFRTPVSPTFHGRDIFAPVAAYLSAGVPSSELGPETYNIVRLPVPEPRRIDDRTLEAEIIHVDRFGNLITSIRSSELPENFRITIGDRTINRRVEYFADESPDDLVAIPGSAGYIEICANQTPAELTTGAGIADRLVVERIG